MTPGTMSLAQNWRYIVINPHRFNIIVTTVSTRKLSPQRRLKGSVYTSCLPSNGVGWALGGEQWGSRNPLRAYGLTSIEDRTKWEGRSQSWWDLRKNELFQTEPTPKVNEILTTTQSQWFQLHKAGSILPCPDSNFLLVPEGMHPTDCTQSEQNASLKWNASPSFVKERFTDLWRSKSPLSTNSDPEEWQEGLTAQEDYFTSTGNFKC